MPDIDKAKEKRRRRALEEAQRIKNAPKTLEKHNEDSKQLLLPEGYNFVAGRDDPYLQTDITFYHNAVTRDFVVKFNNRILGPFKKHELQCLRDCLRNDLDI